LAAALQGAGDSSRVLVAVRFDHGGRLVVPPTEVELVLDRPEFDPAADEGEDLAHVRAIVDADNWASVRRRGRPPARRA